MDKNKMDKKSTSIQMKKMNSIDNRSQYKISMDDKENSSCQSMLSIDDDEPCVNDVAHRLYHIAIEQARRERRRVRANQQRTKSGPARIIERQPLVRKTQTLTDNEIDQLFEEKRCREPMIRDDLMDIYKKSTGRVRSMLDIRQIDRFIDNIRQRSCNV
jgi:hypothetical protein